MPGLRFGFTAVSAPSSLLISFIPRQPGGRSSSELGLRRCRRKCFACSCVYSLGAGSGSSSVRRMRVPAHLGYLIRNHLADDALGCAVQDQVQVVEVPLDDVLAVRALRWPQPALGLLEYPPVPCNTRQYSSQYRVLQYRSVP